MLYSFTKHDRLQSLPAVKGLEIKENDDPLFMSIIGQVSLEEATSRLANDNKAYVAYLDNVPAAFGWMAMGKARIGELNHEFILPLRHRYLWNFRTLPDFRGLGIYTRLLRFILEAEQQNSDCFWIMHAPENKASERGIVKAGFRLAGRVSVVGGGEVIFGYGPAAAGLEDALEAFGFIRSDRQQATCWNCSSPYIANKKRACCCSASDEACNHHLFLGVQPVEPWYLQTI